MLWHCQEKAKLGLHVLGLERETAAKNSGIHGSHHRPGWTLALLWGSFSKGAPKSFPCWHHCRVSLCFSQGEEGKAARPSLAIPSRPYGGHEGTVQSHPLTF